MRKTILTKCDTIHNMKKHLILSNDLQSHNESIVKQIVYDGMFVDPKECLRKMDEVGATSAADWKQKRTQLGLSNYPSKPWNTYFTPKMSSKDFFNKYFPERPINKVDLKECLRKMEEVGATSSRDWFQKRNSHGLTNYPSDPWSYYFNPKMPPSYFFNKYFPERHKNKVDLKECLRKMVGVGATSSRDWIKKRNQLGLTNYPSCPWGYYFTPKILSSDFFNKYVRISTITPLF